MRLRYGILFLAVTLAACATVSSQAIGHQYRQDDWPAIAAAPDGSLWVAWLSFDGDHDDVAIRHYQNGKWSNIHWVPNTSGDSWLPQIAVDSSNRPWVVWSQQLNGSNWDLFARRFDPAGQEWGALERLTSDPLPDINPRLASNGKGRFALVWQGFRGKNSNIFLKTFDGQRWSAETRVTNHPANDWEPAVALDTSGAAWIAYDSYRNGNYDVFLSRVQNGRVDAPEITVAATPLFEARATVAVDGSDRVWVAWETGLQNWGKDQGYIIKDRQTGAFLGGVRQPQIRCYQNGRWLQPAQALGSVLAGDRVSQPHVFASGGSVWVTAKVRKTTLAAKRNPPGYYFPSPQKGYWEYWVTRLDGGHWAEAFPLPDSKGRSSTRLNAVWDASGNLWMTWPTDNRAEGDYHRPLRQQVYAAQIDGSAASTPPVLVAATADKVEPRSGHADEPGDVRAIRGYTVLIDGKRHHIVRGDFHRHTELSWDRGGEPDGSLQDFYRYMIDAAALDFGASTDHQGGAWPYWWWYAQKMTDMYYVPGVYVPVFGYERSAQYPFGHRNMFFVKRSDARVTPFFLKDGVRQFEFPLGAEGDEPGSGSPDLVKNDTQLLYEEIRARNGLAIRHTSATNQGGFWNDNDPALEPVVEIFQGARTSSEQPGGPLVTQPDKDTEQMKLIGYRPEGMISVAWAKGYKLGVIASSDHFSTHISYAMVYTDDPTRKGILDAIRKRHTYGATDNIILDVRMGDHFMGDEFQLRRAEPIRVKALGTRPVVRVELLKDGKVIYATQPGQRDVAFQFNDTSDVSQRHYYYVRLQQDDRMTAWSSPMFVNYR